MGIKQYIVSCLWSTGYIPISSWKFQLTQKKTVRRYGTWRYFAVVVVHRLQLRSKEVRTFANGEFNQQRWWGLTPEKMLVYVGLCGFIHEWQKQRMWTNKDLVLSCGSGDLHAFTQYFPILWVLRGIPLTKVWEFSRLRKEIGGFTAEDQSC